jgi:hypothetical protein
MQFCREITIVVAMNSKETTTKSKPKPSYRCFSGRWMYYFLLGLGPSFFFSHLILFFSHLPFFSCSVGPLTQSSIWLGQSYPVGLATWLGFSPFFSLSFSLFLFFTLGHNLAQLWLDQSVRLSLGVGPVVPHRWHQILPIAVSGCWVFKRITNWISTLLIFIYLWRLIYVF